MRRTHRICIAAIAIGVAVTLMACGGGSKTPTPTAALPSPTSALGTATVSGPTSTSSPAATGTAAAAPTPSASTVDPCTLRTSLEGRPLAPGPSFALDANTKWQLCGGGAATGNGRNTSSTPPTAVWRGR